MMQAIDIVLPWVNGGDPEWIIEKNKYLGVIDDESAVDASVARYRDWDNLQYIFRGIETCMPWVRTVHLVTNGQKPDWLNTDCKRLNWVKHCDFIPEQYLPTFSANPIELNIHRIQGLAETFIYFNDDSFVIDDMGAEDFYDKKLMPKDQAGLWRVIARRYDDVSAYMYLNNTAVINQHFSLSGTLNNKWFTPKNGIRQLAATTVLSCISRNKFMAMYFHHLPQSYRKSIFGDVWRAEATLLDRVCQNRFRTKDDVTHMLMKDWQLASNQFSPSNFSGRGVNFSITSIEDARVASNIIVKKKKKMICLNDWVESDFGAIKPIINDALNERFPEKSGFEL